MEENMTREEFKTIMEMVRMIIEGSADKAEALEKINSLTILKDKKEPTEQAKGKTREGGLATAPRQKNYSKN